MVYDLKELWKLMMHYIEDVVSLFPFKAIVAAVLSVISQYVMSDGTLYFIWFALNVVDLYLGIKLARRTKDPITGENLFSRKKLHSWVIKTFTHTFTVILIGVLTQSIQQVTGVNTLLVYWFTLLLIITEIISIFGTMDKLKYPVNEVARRIASKLKVSITRKIDEKVDGEDDGPKD